MIQVFKNEPVFNRYHGDKPHTMNVRKFFENPNLGGSDLLKMNIHNYSIKTPVLSFLATQENNGFYYISKI